MCWRGGGARCFAAVLPSNSEHKPRRPRRERLFAPTALCLSGPRRRLLPGQRPRLSALPTPCGRSRRSCLAWRLRCRVRGCLPASPRQRASFVSFETPCHTMSPIRTGTTNTYCSPLPIVDVDFNVPRLDQVYIAAAQQQQQQQQQQCWQQQKSTKYKLNDYT